MIISAATDYRAAAQRKLPPFLFHYIDGGAYAEHTLRRNVEDLAQVALRQRVLKNMSALSLETQLFNEKLAMPVALGPVGLCGMYARRGEVQAARAAEQKASLSRSRLFQFAQLKKSHRRLSGLCGFNSMFSKTVVLCVTL